MALTLETAQTSGISLEDYVRQVAQTVDLQDRDAVLQSAGLLRALADNRTVVAEKFNKDIAATMNAGDYLAITSYAATTYVLAKGPGFMVRANLWLPPNGFGKQEESIHELNAYQLPHDHDFSFLTVGYWGGGYATSIYEYDAATLTGEVGEYVDVRFLEQTTLPVGKVMYYRASQDIHTQEYPVEPSVSVNLLIIPDGPRTQYTFDVEEGRVSGLVSNNSEGSVGLCTLARHIGNARTAEHLDRIATEHPVPRLRWAAYESMAALCPDVEGDVLRQAHKDKSDLVSRSAHRALEVLADVGGSIREQVLDVSVEEVSAT